MNTSLVSIVIPIYNVEQWLKRCVDSVINQTYTNLGIILVDDGSTDDCGKICDDYAHADNRIKVIHKSNGGLSDARNAGTEIATGEYIYFLDSDDWIANNTIESLITFALGKNCDIVQGGFYYDYTEHLLYDNRWIKEDAAPVILSREEAMTELIKNEYVKNFAWGKLYKTSFVKRHKFPVGKYFEDSYWQHLIVDQCEKYGIVPQPLYYYLQRGDSISGQYSIKNLDLLIGTEQKFLFIKKNYPDLSPLCAKVFWNLTIDSTILAKKSGDAKLHNAFNSFRQRIEKEYNPSFNHALSKSLKYRLAQHSDKLLDIYNLGLRIYNRIFAKRLKRIECP